MKKLLIMTIILLLCLVFSACDEKKEFSGSPNDIPLSVVKSDHEIL